MPRRSQEAEDEAFAKALQDEYRQEFIRRQAEQNVDLEGDTANSEQRKKKSKKKSKNKKGSKRRNDRSRSSSRDSTTERRRRRRQRSNSDDEYQQESMDYGVIPLPPPPFVHDRDSHKSRLTAPHSRLRPGMWRFGLPPFSAFARLSDSSSPFSVPSLHMLTALSCFWQSSRTGTAQRGKLNRTRMSGSDREPHL